jgi:hypothetical protein
MGLNLMIINDLGIFHGSNWNTGREWDVVGFNNKPKEMPKSGSRMVIR